MPHAIPSFFFLFLFWILNLTSAQSQYFLIQEGYHWGLINQQGEILIPPEYHAIHENISDIRDGQKLIRVMGEYGFGLYHLDWGEIIPTKMDSIQIRLGVDGRTYVIVFYEKRQHLLDEKADIIASARPGIQYSLSGAKPAKVDSIWQDIVRFQALNVSQESAPPIRSLSDLRVTNALGVGRSLIRQNQDSLSRFLWGLQPLPKSLQPLLRSHLLHGIWNHSSESWLIPPDYRFLTNEQDGQYAFKRDTVFGILRLDGKETIIPDTDFLPEPIEGGWTYSVKANTAFTMDFDGNYIASIDAYNFRSVADNRIAFQKKQLWGLLNERLQVIIEPTFRSIGTFHEGLAVAQNTSGYQFIDVNGKTVIRGAFQQAQKFSCGLAVVHRGKKKILIDKKGKRQRIPNSRGIFFEGFYPSGFALVNRRKGDGLI
ncbi:MAG: WG repeat-containing protein, partial [Bacteroidota bacterium]